MLRRGETLWWVGALLAVASLLVALGWNLWFVLAALVGVCLQALAAGLDP